MAATRRRRPLLQDPTALAARRVDSGISQKALAQKAGISWPFLSQLESGVRGASAETLGKLAKALKCEIRDIRNPHLFSPAAAGDGEGAAND